MTAEAGLSDTGGLGTDGEFRTATAVHPADGGSYSATVADGWDIAGNANGGYLLAIVARALSDATGRPDPVSVTGHFLSPGKPGPMSVATAIIKTGRRFTTATATMSTADPHAPSKPVVTVLGTFGDLAEAVGPESVHGRPPELPPPGECVPVVSASPFPPPFMDRVELRLMPDDAHFFDGEPTGDARMRGWFRLRHDEPIDTVALLCAVDAFPPTIFNTKLPVAWTPTVELTAHIRAAPVAGWLACSFSTRFVTGGFLEADGEVWDATGRLVAQSRQLALVPRSD